MTDPHLCVWFDFGALEALFVGVFGGMCLQMSLSGLWNAVLDWRESRAVQVSS